MGKHIPVIFLFCLIKALWYSKAFYRIVVYISHVFLAISQTWTSEHVQSALLCTAGSYQETKLRIMIFHGMVNARLAAIIELNDLFKQQIRKYNTNSEI